MMSTKVMKHISCLLAVIMLVNMLPLNSFAQEYRESLVEAPEGAGQAIAPASKEVVSAQITEEVESKRTEFSKEFMLNNGLRMAAVYPDAVHYQQDGQWKEIDNTLKNVRKNDGTAYTNTAGVWNVSFPDVLSATNAVTIEKGGYMLSFYMSGELRIPGGLSTAAVDKRPVQTFAVESAKTAAALVQSIDLKAQKAAAEHPETILEKQYSRLQYAGVYENTDIIYDLQGNAVKESVVLQQYNSTLQGYRYTLKTGAMVPVLEKDGSITLYDEKQQAVVMYMPAPYLLDGAKVCNYDVKVTLTGSNGTYTLTYLLPQTWLAEESRQWPVVLDPVVHANTSISNIKDATVASNGNKESFRDGSIECGVNSTYGIRRIFLKYDQLPVLTSADVVVGATISLYKLQTSTNETTIQVHKLHNTWTSDSVTWSNYFGTTDANYDPTVVDYTRVRVSQWYSWDITDIAREWYEGQNTGMLFRLRDEVTTDRLGQFASSEYANVTNPVLSIYFRNNNGLESYWDYTSVSAGRGGTGYINNFTGNLVWVHEDIGFGGNRMPVSISHVYNANDASTNFYGMGYGWRTNFNQRVYQWSVDASYYVWEDADATRHYFKYDAPTNTYKDEDGLELTLAVTSDGYTITDKHGNYSYFNSRGCLAGQYNKQQTQSSITITFTDSTGWLISTITDGAGRVYHFSYPNGLLSRISYVGKGSTELSYVSFGYTDSLLTSVTDADGRSATYEYTTGNLLSTARDIDGYRLSFQYNTYEPNNPSRVSKITEYDGDILGGELNIEYSHNQTTFTDHNGNVQISQFNNWGNTMSVQDGEGRAQYAQYAFGTAQDAQENTDSTKKANQLRLSSKLQNTVGNYLRESSFETGTPWYATANIAMSRTTETAYAGSASLKLTSSVTGSDGACSHDFYVANGETVTVSAYIKTTDSAAALALQSDPTNNGTVYAQGATIPIYQDWSRQEVTVTNTTGQTVRMWAFLFVFDPGTVYIDCIQVEKTQSASRFNLVQNGDFRHGTTHWLLTNVTASNVTSVTPATATLDGNAAYIDGDPDIIKHFYQQIHTSGEAGDTYVLAGWAKGDSVPLTGNRNFSLVCIFHNTDGSVTERSVTFNPDTNSTEAWQYAAGAVVADKDFHTIYVDIRYDYNMNRVYFDGIQLFKEEFGNSYTYDSQGNVVSVVDLQKQTTTYEYTNNELTRQLLPNGTAYTYQYDTWGNVTTATSSTGQQYVLSYDTYGNNTYIGIEGLSVRATYTEDGNFQASVTDTLGNVTTYGYNENTSVLEWVQYPEDTVATRTGYTYDSLYRMTSALTVTDTGTALSAAYLYADDLLATLSTGSTTYNFTYGAFSQTSAISVGSRTLASYSYTQDRNRYLSSLTYGNEDRVQYSYDALGRVTAHTYEDGDTVSYRYDNNGSLARVEDSATGRTTAYYYDFAGRSASCRTTGSNYSHGVTYGYDGQNNLTTVTEEINGQTRTTTYGYDGENRLTYLSDGTTTRSYTYDGVNRLIQETTVRDGQTVLTVTYTYCTNEDGYPTTRVSSKAIEGLNYYYKVWYYGYDDNGNITSVFDNSMLTYYTYDSANQLVGERYYDDSMSRTWSYDNAGNITDRTVSQYVIDGYLTVMDTQTYDYSYEESPWGDLLTGYDGQAITSDAIGNMLTDGTWTYTWEHGRQLATMTDGTTTWSYTYDADGMRTSRTNGTTAYSYIYNGGKLSQMTVGSDTLRFSYDAMGSPMTVTWNGEVYTYITNLQGDVMEILNSAGNLVASYDYDAYGMLLSYGGYSSAAALATLNPLRYRGYVYDTETGLYYLQSRYYDPELGRFISADAFVATGQGFVGNNMFAYCNNNPVIFSDSTGNLPIRSTEFGAAAMLRDGTATRGGIIPDKVREAEELEKQGKNLFNTSEKAVLAADDYAFYKGALVVRTNGVRSGSFGVIFLTRETNTRKNPEDVVRHEYGHIKQLQQLDIIRYALCIGLPSWQQWGKGEYYSKPWEITADIYGGVESRTHLKTHVDAGFTYLENSKWMGPLVWLYID